MIQRAIVHVAGPAGSGKTAFVEAMLGAADALILAARCVRDDSLRRSRETRPKADPELRRYRRAGASGVARFAFPKGDIGSEEFFMTDLMGDYSRAVVLEGDNPVGFVDLEVFVAPAPHAGKGLFSRRRRERAVNAPAQVTAVRRVLRTSPKGAALLDATPSGALAELAERYPGALEEARRVLLDGIVASQRGSPPKAQGRWALADPFTGIESAGLVVFNIRGDGEREAAERLVAELARLRKDADLFNDIIGPRGARTPITAVVANLADPGDPGRKKALARVRRCVRSVSA